MRARSLLAAAVPAVLAVLALALGAAGCGSVESTYLRRDYDVKDKLTLKRIGVYAQPAQDGPHDLPDLMAAIAKKHIQQHTQYLVLRSGRLDAAGSPTPAEIQKLGTKLDGVLILRARVLSRDDEEVDLDLTARLVRARDGVEVWRADAADDFESADEDLSKLTATYRGRYGDTADAFVAPLFLLFRDTFESLPSPTLDDEDVLEKIELEG